MSDFGPDSVVLIVGRDRSAHHVSVRSEGEWVHGSHGIVRAGHVGLKIEYHRFKKKLKKLNWHCKSVRVRISKDKLKVDGEDLL